MNLLNKNVMISGGSSGIGFALAKEMAAMGANITILARRKELLESAISEIKKYAVAPDQDFKWFSADVSNFDKLKRVLSADKTSYDILINSAGIAYPGKFVDMDPAIFKNVIDINYLGTVYLTKMILPKMIEKKSGYIVNISSIAALGGIYGHTAYAPSKYAVRGFSRCLRSELKSYGIDVSVVLPQDTDTPQLAFDQSLSPEITKKINHLIENIFGSASSVSAEKAADYIISGMRKKKFTILFGIEGKIGALISPLLDRLFYKYAVYLSKKELTK